LTGSRLFWRLYLGYVGLILLTAAVVGVLTGRRVEDDSMREARETLHHRAFLVREIARPLFRPDLSPETTSTLAASLDRLADETETRFTLIAADGRVLVDSERDPTTLENHGDRPEILAAREEGVGLATRTSTTLRRRMVYLAISSETEAGGWVRVAVPLRSLAERQRELRTIIALAAASASLVGLLFGGFVVRNFTRPLVEMSRTARAISAGDLDRRIDVRRRDELGTFGRAFNRMAGQVRERIVHVTEERNRLLTTLGSMVEGVVTVDADEIVLHLNGPAAEILGASPSGALGEPFGSITRVTEVRETLVETLRTGREQIREIVLPAAPKDRILEVHAAPIRTEGEERGGAVVVLHDVTELRRLEAVRRDFVANVSHEMKTPLTVIQGLVETLVEDPDMPPATRQRFLGKVADQTRRVSSIVTDLLTLSRIESGAGGGRSEPLDLREVVAEVGRGIVATAEDRGITVSSTVPDEPVGVRGDRGFLRLAVDNLVLNAVKYTPRGGRVEIRLGGDADEALLEVADTGIGIEEKHRDRLFERFYRVDAARSRDLGGTGLGLSIVKHVVLAHGGDVDFDSVPGEGSTFRIRLPRTILAAFTGSSHA
jgi:two-component system phosphate regulon sensor histidine kinase PhoR